MNSYFGNDPQDEQDPILCPVCGEILDVDYDTHCPKCGEPIACKTHFSMFKHMLLAHRNGKNLNK